MHTVAWFIRSDMGFVWAALAVAGRCLGRQRERQSIVYQSSFVEFAHGRFTTRLWQLEQHAPSFYSLERQRDLGRFTRKNGSTAWFWMVNDDATNCKVHHHAAGAVGGNQAMGRTKGAKYQGLFGSGRVWLAPQSNDYKRNRCWLQKKSI